MLRNQYFYYGFQETNSWPGSFPGAVFLVIILADISVSGTENNLLFLRYSERAFFSD
jgi:hypothetical protein